LAKLITDNFSRNAFSTGSKPRLLIDIGRSWDTTKGCFQYPTFFRNFCYGGDLRIHNIHNQLQGSATNTTDNLCNYIATGDMINGETLPTIDDSGSTSFSTSGTTTTGVDPYGVFTRGDTIEFIDHDTGTLGNRPILGETIIMSGNMSANDEVDASLYDDSLRIKGISGLQSTMGYRIHRDYFDEVTQPPSFQNSVDRLGGLASSGSVTFGLANIKQEGTRKNWDQSNSQSTYSSTTQMSKYWSQFIYNQTGDALDNLEAITSTNWGIEGSHVKIHLVYCEDIIYRGVGKITTTGTDVFTAIDHTHRWTFSNNGFCNVKVGDELILHNKVSDGSEDTNCKKYTLNATSLSTSSDTVLVMPTDFVTGVDNDQYYYTIKRKNHMSWSDFYNGRVLLFEGVLNAVTSITEANISFAAESKALTSLKKDNFGWEKIDSGEKEYGINYHLFNSYSSIGKENGMDPNANDKVIPIFFGDARLNIIHDPAGDDATNNTEDNLTKGDFVIGQSEGVISGISNYVTPIKICDKTVTQDLMMYHTHGEGWTELDLGYDPAPLIVNGNQRNAKLKAFLVSKYPMYVTEQWGKSYHSQQTCPQQRYPSRRTGELTINADGKRGMLFPQRFRANDNIQGTIIWAHTEDSREDSAIEGDSTSGSFELEGYNNHWYSYNTINSGKRMWISNKDGALSQGDWIEISDTTIHNCSFVYVWTAGGGDAGVFFNPEAGLGGGYIPRTESSDGGAITGTSDPNAGSGLYEPTTQVHVLKISNIAKHSSTQLLVTIDNTNLSHSFTTNDTVDIFESSNANGQKFTITSVNISDQHNLVIEFGDDADTFSTESGTAYCTWGGNSSGTWTKISEWTNVWDNPRVKWALLPNKNPSTSDVNYLFHDGTLSNTYGGTADKVLDWETDPQISDSINSYAGSDVAATGSTGNQRYVYTTWDLQEMPQVDFNRHYFMQHRVMNNYIPDIAMFSTYVSGFFAKSTVSDYEGWNDTDEGGLVFSFKPGYDEPNPNGIKQFHSVTFATSDLPEFSATHTNVKFISSDAFYLHNQYFKNISKSVGIGVRTDDTGSPVNEGNIDPKLYLYFFKLHVDAFHRIEEDSVVYNGYGSPVGHWCTNRKVANGFDEQHSDELTSTSAYTDGIVQSTGNLSNDVFGTNFFGQSFERHNEFSSASAPFASYGLGNFLVFDNDGVPEALMGGKNSIMKRTPEWATMNGQNSSSEQYADGIVMIGNKSSNSVVNLFDPVEKTKRATTSTTYYGSLLNDFETIGKFPSTNYNSFIPAFTSNMEDCDFRAVQGKACLNPITQLEQLLRWELYWDDTIIDENSFNTASNDRSADQGWVLIQSELSVMGYVDAFCKSTMSAAWMDSGGKLKIKAYESSDPYSATKVNNVTGGTGGTNRHAPSEILNLCTNNPHIGWKFNHQNKYQIGNDEMNSIYIHEDSSTAYVVNLFSSSNSSDPITAASNLQTAIRSASVSAGGYGNDWIVRFKWDTQKFELDSGSGNTIYAFGKSQTSGENNHNSACSQFGFYKDYQSFSASPPQTLESHFAVSILPVYGHMIVKDSLSCSKTNSNDIQNDITIKYVDGRSVNVTDATSIAKYGKKVAEYSTVNISDQTSATNYADRLLARNANSRITIDFDIAGASGVVFEIWDIIAISHELLRSFWGKVYNSSGSGVNNNKKFMVLSSSYKGGSNTTHITAEEMA